VLLQVCECFIDCVGSEVFKSCGNHPHLLPRSAARDVVASGVAEVGQLPGPLYYRHTEYGTVDRSLW